MNTYKLSLAIPSKEMWHAEFAISVVNFSLYYQRVQVPGYKGNGLHILNKQSSLLPKSRQELIMDAIACGDTHILFVDSDQTFPNNLVHRMAARQKQVIGCNIATKILPASPTARVKDPAWPGGKPLFTDPDSTGAVKVWRLGFGVILMDLSIFKRIPKPWFSIVWNEQMNDFTGEDWFFCEKLEAAGIDIWVDQDVSKEIGHIGRLEYTHDLVGDVVRQEVAA